MTLPTDPKARKAIPVMSGVLDYFPDALAAVAAVSKAGNDQHNPGQPLHWSRGKSMDHADTCLRHLMERGSLDTDGQRHSAKAAWRALAILQEELEAEGAPMARGARPAQDSIEAVRLAASAGTPLIDVPGVGACPAATPEKPKWHAGKYDRETDRCDDISCLGDRCGF